MFEWDENKRWINLLKHGIDFADLGDFFDGVMVLAPARSDTEPRQKAIGTLSGHVVTIIFTAMGETRRIISARKAKRNERGKFDEVYTRWASRDERRD